MGANADDLTFMEELEGVMFHFFVIIIGSVTFLYQIQVFAD